MRKENKEVLDYEYNLRMHYEAKRKELDILLSSSIPAQMSNIKTILWINFLMVGLMLQFVQKTPMPDIMTGFFLLSIIAIVLLMWALLTNRVKSYGVIKDILHMSEIHKEKWTISQAIMDMLGAVNEDIIENRIAIGNRAKLMHLSTYFTMFALLFLVSCFVLREVNL